MHLHDLTSPVLIIAEDNNQAKSILYIIIEASLLLMSLVPWKKKPYASWNKNLAKILKVIISYMLCLWYLCYVWSHLCFCKGEFQFDEVADVDMQSKLLATWETLQVTMQDRLFFMDKYSSFAYAAEMSRAVDMWSEVAVFVIAVREMHHLYKKYQVQ